MEETSNVNTPATAAARDREKGATVHLVLLYATQNSCSEFLRLAAATWLLVLTDGLGDVAPLIFEIHVRTVRKEFILPVIPTRPPRHTQVPQGLQSRKHWFVCLGTYLA